MRTLVAVVAVIAMGCNEHGEGGAIFCLNDGQVHEPGDFYPAGDGCNFCTCEIDGEEMCSNDPCNSDGGIRDDGGFTTCFPSGFCGSGVECGEFCCNPGERCDQGSCTCGVNGPCIQGDSCVTGGPVGGGGDGCGSICCGVTQPCPI